MHLAFISLPAVTTIERRPVDTKQVMTSSDPSTILKHKSVFTLMSMLSHGTTPETVLDSFRSSLDNYFMLE
jgi:hypothetical protein